MNSLKELIIEQKENEELKNQIEKMKCCENCKYDVWPYVIHDSGPCGKCNHNSKWELKEE